MTTPPQAAARPSPGGQSGQGQAQQAAPRPYPFPVGVYSTESQDGGQFSMAQTSAAQQFPIYNVSPTGWIRGIWCDFGASWASGNSASVSYHNDNPWSAVNKCTLRDLGQQAIIGPIGGYDWMNLDKFGAYFNISDPRADVTYAASTGTGAGTITFSLYLPFEFVARDALGVAENQSKPGWTVEIWLDSAANSFNTAPSVAATWTINFFPDSYTKPIAQAPSGRAFSQAPPLPGTLQYWRSENAVQPASSSEYDLVNGIGFPLRTICYKVIDTSAGTRSDTDFPSPATYQYGNVILRAITQNRWQSEMGRAFGYLGAAAAANAADAAMQREKGVYVVWFTRDFGQMPGQELRHAYLDTQTNTLFRFSGTFAAACTLYVLTNWIAPVSKNYYSLVAG